MPCSPRFAYKFLLGRLANIATSLPSSSLLTANSLLRQPLGPESAKETTPLEKFHRTSEARQLHSPASSLPQSLFFPFFLFFHSFFLSLLFFVTIGGFHVTSSPPCWWTVNKRSLISSLCLSTSICSFHHCYLCLPRLHGNHLFDGTRRGETAVSAG